MSLFGREPPSSQGAEQAVLGGLLADNRCYEDVAGWLRPEHFYDPANGAIYAAIARRIDAGALADGVVLARDVGEWAEAFDGAEAARGYLARLLVAMVSPRVVGEYGRAVLDCWHRRELAAVAAELQARAYDPAGATAREIQEAAEERLAAIADGVEAEAAPISAAAAMGLAIDQAVRARDRPSGLVGITTGLRELDAITGGLQGGLYYVLGARPSMGKTTLAQAIGAGAAAAGARVLLVSMEMTSEALGGQLVAGLTPINRDLATRGKRPDRDEMGRYVWHRLEDGQVDAMCRAQAAMRGRAMDVVYLRNPTMGALRSLVRRRRRRGGLDLVLVDYLGLMRVPELARFDNRTLEMTRLSGAAKAMAVDFGLPVVMLSQLNRQVEGREGNRPGLADLRDSGAIEQDADVVMFLHREHYYLSRNLPVRGPRDDAEAWANKQSAHAHLLNAAKGRAEVIVAKQRLGRTGSAFLAFDDDTTWFRDLVEGGDGPGHG